MFTKPHRDVSRVFIHCSASDVPAHDNVATMRKWHMEDNGWSDVGYHLFIRKNGELEEGRPLEKIPAAQGGNNTGTIAICLHGLKKSKFTEAQFYTLRKLCREINVVYEGDVTFHGHKEVAAKSCPVFDYKKVLNLSPEGELRPEVAHRDGGGGALLDTLFPTMFKSKELIFAGLGMTPLVSGEASKSGLIDKFPDWVYDAIPVFVMGILLLFVINRLYARQKGDR